ncbi:c-type cytochrome [Candidatus Oscillochloris fontis]|uniref:c-type cytochrome n=1 Tax=Candidatus Oscillochloris fontis TaxID=2496868 RepID=UPI00101C9628|nr:cytochrome c [Candidatus Oscillochloris fontis]
MQQQIKLGAIILIGLSLIIGMVLLVVIRGNTIPASPPVAQPSIHADSPVESELRIRGEQLFNNLGCAACHQEHGAGLGPRLHGLYDRQVSLADGSDILADDAYLYESILNPAAKVVKSYNPIMPAYEGQLKEDEVRQLIAYLKSLAE